jgi:hypothetical protein
MREFGSAQIDAGITSAPVDTLRWSEVAVPAYSTSTEQPTNDTKPKQRANQCKPKHNIPFVTAAEHQSGMIHAFKVKSPSFPPGFDISAGLPKKN